MTGPFYISMINMNQILHLDFYSDFLKIFNLTNNDWIVVFLK